MEECGLLLATIVLYYVAMVTVRKLQILDAVVLFSLPTRNKHDVCYLRADGGQPAASG